jgi:DnaJ-domain-containing protein 1
MHSRRYFAAAAKSVLEKDYYSILDVPAYATQEEIKEAYRALAKKHHPDVRATADAVDTAHDPDVEKFRDVVEAYQVLSVRESRAAFDISRRNHPEKYNSDTNSQFEMMLNRENRDKRGVSPRSRAARGSYAEERLAELKAEREKYNVNHLGYYNGGVPRRDRGPMRGAALASPGVFHSPAIHNYLENQHVDSYRVTAEDAAKFKHYMGTDKADFNRTMPAYPMFYDHNHSYRTDRDFWLKFLLGVSFISYGLSRLQVESDRARMSERLSGFPNSLGHHFNNRGGVVVKKKFTGFEKYHASSEDYMVWLNKAYPSEGK